MDEKIPVGEGNRKGHVPLPVSRFVSNEVLQRTA